MCKGNNSLGKVLQPRKKPSKKEERPIKMVSCPGCGLGLPEADTAAQVAHMEANHPEIIAQRLDEVRSDIEGVTDLDLL